MLYVYTSILYNSEKMEDFGAPIAKQFFCVYILSLNKKWFSLVIRLQIAVQYLPTTPGSYFSSREFRHVYRLISKALLMPKLKKD